MHHGSAYKYIKSSRNDVRNFPEIFICLVRFTSSCFHCIVHIANDERHVRITSNTPLESSPVKIKLNKLVYLMTWDAVFLKQFLLKTYGYFVYIDDEIISCL